MFSSCKDIKELQECLVKKQEWIEYLEKQCDDIDELEAQYKEEIAQLCKERDALKAQIDPSSVPVVPNLQEALKKGQVP
ncbi:hypothetical protein OESDEN_19256 [Oesophagostomum dentatum]|uniref:Uncharacterized protein n=1 Tax=Oesophagostomum dentatum TaxID=61180 RepID=A0A0B1SB00_OESDE|nr:hypothetical protein OESDEN_19256 [Oesophagostomum dentatum]